MNSITLAPMLVLMLCSTTMTEGDAGARSQERPSPQTAAFWVTFAPRSHTGAVDSAETPLTARCLARRAVRGDGGPLVDERDLPVERAFVDAVLGTGATLRASSRWFHAVSVQATEDQRARIATLPFVRGMRPVERAVRQAGPVSPLDWSSDGGVAGGLDYGASSCQIDQIDLTALHTRGFRGEGMVIGVLDTGFSRVHQAFNQPDHVIEVLAEWDFIGNDGNTAPQAGDPPNQHVHGTTVLSTMAGWLPGQLIGAAPDAAYVLAKTEIDAPPDILAELDYYVAGLEFIEAQGADVATSSLGYVIGFTYPTGLDGASCIASAAANVATSKGMVCLTSAGNGSHDCDPATLALWAPADALEIIACGSASVCGTASTFSSDGPTADGRIKPELLGMGEEVVFASGTASSGLSSASGTSLSTPLIAGAVACILQARPCLDVADLRAALFQTASGGGVADALHIRGYGVVRANAASLLEPPPSAVGQPCDGMPSEPLEPAGPGCAQPPCPSDLNCDGILNGADLGLLLLQWGPCDCECAADTNGDGTVDGADLGQLLLCWPV